MSVSVKFIDGNGNEVEDTPERQRTRVGTPFVIDADAQTKLDDLKRRAEANVIDQAAMLALAAAYQSGKRGAPEFAIAQTIELTFGWTITYTVEEHKAGVPCRHMSMASANPVRAPSPHAVEMVMQRLGFINDLRGCHVWKEDMLNGGAAINVLEPMSGRMADLAR